MYGISPSLPPPSCPMTNKALGLDPSLPAKELVKEAQGIKRALDRTAKAADWSHLIGEDKLKDCVIQVGKTNR